MDLQLLLSIAIFTIGNCNIQIYNSTYFYAPISFNCFKSELPIFNFVVRCGLQVAELKSNSFLNPSLFQYRFKKILQTWLNYHKIYDVESHSGICISVRRIFRKKMKESNKNFRLRKDLRKHLTRSLRRRRFPVQRHNAI